MSETKNRGHSASKTTIPWEINVPPQVLSMVDEVIPSGLGYAGFLEKNVRSFSWRRYPASPPDVGP